MNQSNEVFAVQYENVDTSTVFVHYIIIQNSNDYDKAWRDALEIAIKYTNDSPFLLRGLRHLGVGMTDERTF